jgi:hypothetical protein
MRSLSTREVHIKVHIRETAQIAASPPQLNFGVRGLDVVLGDRHVSVPQDSLDDLVGNSKLVKIRRQTTAKRMPTMALDSRFDDQRHDDVCRQSVQLDRLSHGAKKHQEKSALRGKADQTTRDHSKQDRFVKKTPRECTESLGIHTGSDTWKNTGGTI